jgi:hypothetical protein
MAKNDRQSSYNGSDFTYLAMNMRWIFAGTNTSARLAGRYVNMRVPVLAYQLLPLQFLADIQECGGICPTACT